MLRLSYCLFLLIREQDFSVGMIIVIYYILGMYQADVERQ